MVMQRERGNGSIENHGAWNLSRLVKNIWTKWTGYWDRLIGIVASIRGVDLCPCSGL